MSALPFPPGANASDTLIAAAHFNLTALRAWNYTLYANATLSNTSACYLVFAPYVPAHVFANGSFTNATSCFTPVRPIRARGSLSLLFGTLFAGSVLFSLVNLRRHGRGVLPAERRWGGLLGRRVAWYWMLFVAAGGIVSAFTGVDVDRDYLQSTAVVLEGFFYTLMLPGLLAVVWEGVRHWGSTLARQLYDADPFAPALSSPSLRTQIEFYLPLLFYLLAWLVFFLAIPRPWSPLQLQRSPEQTAAVAEPAATDARFKAAALCAAAALGVVCFGLAHSVYHYQLRSVNAAKGTAKMSLSALRLAPPKLLLAISLLTLRIGYAIASAWIWSISPYNVSASLGWLFGLGYGPALVILVVFNVYGYIEDNEDRVLIALRARRDEGVERELGVLSGVSGRGRIRGRPGWWGKSHLHAGRDVQMRDDGGWGGGIGRRGQAADNEDADESGYWWWQRRKEEEREAEKRSSDKAGSLASSTRYVAGSSMLLDDVDFAHPDAKAVPRWKKGGGGGSDVDSERTAASSLRSGTSGGSRQQVVRSMLDV